MTNRITQAQLESLVAAINRATNSPMEYSRHDEQGNYAGSNVGHYCLSYAYGGVQLQRVVNEGGGVTTPIGGGYLTKRELYYRLHAFLSGLTA